MSTHSADAGRDAVDVHNRLDKVVLAIAPQGGGAAETNLTADQAREVATALTQAAETAERTEPS